MTKVTGNSWLTAQVRVLGRCTWRHSLFSFFLFPFSFFLPAALGQFAIGPKPTCPPGCKIVEEIVMKEQPRFCCEVVPNVKKKWVYDWVEDGFCIPHSPLHGKACDKVPHCRACSRKQLVKKQVEECVGHKCEVKKTMETVPCKVYRIVPCTTAEGAPGALPPGIVPPPGDIQPTGSDAAPVTARERLLPYFVLDRIASPASIKPHRPE